ncbi:hypothetical protein A6M14_10140 [Acinetobacter sp. Ac_877]|uniref:hypothetical protein n=1 Tax=Acinetobacter portensis TaxID=1839785 RepID=UPI00128DF6D4|nr:hypothetical protein [Acinetobacter portensis]MPW41829.1 hypothetical protein [Acinetobacter portensis]
MNINFFALVVVSLTVTSCAIFPTLDERMAKCEAKGISKDVCYQVEMNKERDLLNSAMHAPDTSKQK